MIVPVPRLAIMPFAHANANISSLGMPHLHTQQFLFMPSRLFFCFRKSLQFSKEKEEKLLLPQIFSSFYMWLWHTVVITPWGWVLKSFEAHPHFLPFFSLFSTFTKHALLPFWLKRRMTSLCLGSFRTLSCLEHFIVLKYLWLSV